MKLNKNKPVIANLTLHRLVIAGLTRNPLFRHVIAGLTRNPLKKALLFFLCTVAFQTQAQTKQWSLEECIRYAVDHNIAIRQISVQKDIAEVNLNTAQMSRLPDLSAGIDQNFSFGRTQIQSGLYENQSQSNSSFSLGTSIPVFTGFRIPNEIAKNKLDLAAAAENLEKAKEDLALNVASLFLQVLFNKELLKINREQLLLSQAQIERTLILTKAGKVPLSQLYDIEAQAANDKVSVVEAENNLKLALLDLAQSLELEQFADFDIVTPEYEDVVAEYISSVQPPQVVFNNAVQIKPVIKEQQYRVESAEKSLKIAQAGYLPTLNLNAGYGVNYFYLYDKKLHNTDFSYQFRNNAREYIGLSLGIPIFSRFSVRNQVRNARFNILDRQLALDNTKKTLFKEIQTAYLNAVAAQEKYRASQQAIKASSESFNYARERYETGKTSVFEFNEAKTKLVRSQSEEIQAKYDYIFRTKILDFYNGIPIKL
jgi:outer membrane protein